MNSLRLHRRISISIFKNEVINEALLIMGASLLIAVGAQLSIPIGPVPITLQNFVVFFVAMSLGPRLGGAAVALYLFEGLVGLPVFANFLSGPVVLFGPRAGYLFGFLFAAIISGYLSEKGWAARRWTTVLAIVFSSIVLFACGYTVLAMFIGSEKAYLCGVAPFYWVEIIKISILSVIVPHLWKSQQ